MSRLLGDLTGHLQRIETAFSKAGAALGKAPPPLAEGKASSAAGPDEKPSPSAGIAPSGLGAEARALVEGLLNLPGVASQPLPGDVGELLRRLAPDLAAARAAADVPGPAAAPPPPPPSASGAGAALFGEDDASSRPSGSPCRGSLRPDEEGEDSGHPAADDAEDIPVVFKEISLDEFDELEEAEASARDARQRGRRLAHDDWRAKAEEASARGEEIPPMPAVVAEAMGRQDTSIKRAAAAAGEARLWMSQRAGGESGAPAASPWAAAWPSQDAEGDDAPDFAAFSLRVVYESGRTGFADDKDFKPRVGSVIAGRFRVTRRLGSAAFSQAVAAVDLSSGTEVCLKIVKNNKEYFDQSLDEIKLLEYVNRRAADVLRRFRHGGDGPRPSEADAEAAGRVLRLVDFFYFQEHLFLVTELLKDNLYDLQKFLYRRGLPAFFTPPRVRSVARQILSALSFVHGVGILHCDLKPENLLLSSYSRCLVKVIDFGSSCFATDSLTSYIQSRSYRAPEVILGCDYGPKIDVWSLGCILFELVTGRVLFVNDSVPTILARMQAVLGPIPTHMVERGKESNSFLTPRGHAYEAPEHEDEPYLIISPVASTFEETLAVADPELCDFLKQLLTIDPALRPTAEEALQHPFMKNDREFHPYELLPAGRRQE